MRFLFSQKILDHAWILLPLGTVILLAATIPPINFWPLGFVALAPLYLFAAIYSTSGYWKRLMWGGFFVGTVFSAVILSLTVLQFNWIKEAHIFTTGVKLFFIPSMLLIGIIGAIGMLFPKMLPSRNPFLNIFSFAAGWTIVEWIIKKLLFNLEYSILGYPATFTFFLPLAGIGGVLLLVFVIALINASIGSLAFYAITAWRKTIPPEIIRSGALASASIIVAVIALPFIAENYYPQTAPSSAKKQLSVAIIQNQDRGAGAFGQEINGVFRFPSVEKQIAEANALSPDVIIYPFAPWAGAIGENKDNSIFDRQVLATDFSTFGKWENTYVKKDVIFITWNTAYRDGQFFNELDFWKNGEVIGVYQKKALFPFMDYTPSAVQSFGLYTTPYDATPGIRTSGIPIHEISIGGLVCSEVSTPIDEDSLADIDLVLAIGSEAIFSNGFAGELNLANARYRAAESHRPVIRANRFGPSAFIDSQGKILSSMPYGANGVFFGTIEADTDNDTLAPYPTGRENAFIIGIFSLLATIAIIKILQRKKAAREAALP